TAQHRRQGRPLREEGPGGRGGARRVGGQVRGDGQEVQRPAEGAAGAGGVDRKYM
ncbi:hypothetical protein KEM52_004683, partial [Ascosphaera acerosa]